jgi:hypothetical protein
MGCGCGGSSNVYKPPTPGAQPEESARPAIARGLPKVWNGPQPKAAAPKP